MSCHLPLNFAADQNNVICKSISMPHFHNIATCAKGVKESSERAILHLRSLQTQYVAAVRRAGASKSPSNKVTPPDAASPTFAHPTTALFRSHEVLRPFLLAMNSPDASPALIEGALNSIQLLLRGDAVKSSDGGDIARGLGRLSRECRPHVLTGGSGVGVGVSSALGLFRQERVLTLNQRAAKEDQSTALKVLRTMTMLVDSRSVELTLEVLEQCLMGCCVLGVGEDEVENVDGNVKRAAVATMNQVLSILLERARDVMLDSSAGDIHGNKEHDESLILNVTMQTLADLCSMVYNYQEKSQKRLIVGPFKAAAKEKMPPSPTTCLSLIDMLFKQRGADFFRVCQIYFKSDGGGSALVKNEVPQNLQFAIQFIQQTCQLVLFILRKQHGRHLSKEEASDSTAFCLFYYATSLGSTILANYLTPTSLIFYENLDTIPLLDNQETPVISHSALEMIGLLVGYVSGATDVYHKSEFEDGYMFNQTERESLNIGKDNDAPYTPEDSVANRRKSTVQTATVPVNHDHLVSNDQLWRALLSLEVIYCLMCNHLYQIVLLDSSERSHNIKNKSSANSENDSKSHATIISAITKATSDLATISSSNRERILHVVIIAHDDTSAVGEPSSVAASLAEKFSDSQSSRCGEAPICDTGLATWLSFKCILALVRSMKQIVLSSREVEDPESHRTNARQILTVSFAPSVSVLQHYIKRMSGSHIVVSQTLMAYEELAYTSMVLDSIEEKMRRHTILTSLCKLCLPSWGKNRSHS
jgi:hypothetical protein